MSLPPFDVQGSSFESVGPIAPAAVVIIFSLASGKGGSYLIGVPATGTGSILRRQAIFLSFRAEILFYACPPFTSAALHGDVDRDSCRSGASPGSLECRPRPLPPDQR